MASLGRSSAMIAAGTMISRVTGLVRSVLLVAVIGAVGFPADAFSTAMFLPNMIFAILSAGLLTAVFVPQIVKAAHHEDGGSAFVSRLFTLATVLLLGVTVIAMVAAPLFVSLLAKDYPPEAYALAVALAYWCIPQVFFFGIFALVGETLNARKVYGPYTWAPIANNVVSIAGFAVFLVLFHTPLQDANDWTPARIALLGGVATGGIVVQFLVLMLFWRRAGIHVRPNFTWRGVGLGDVVRLAGWTFLMVILGQIAAGVQVAVMNSASGTHPGAQVWNLTWLVFMLPYSVIVLSIGTPYFTRLSESAAAGDAAAVRTDIIASIRTLGVFIVLALAAVSAAAYPLVRLFSESRETAVFATPVLWAFLVSLLPLSVLFIIQRTFYAHGDTRSAFLFTLVQMIVVVTLTLCALWFVPIEWRTTAAALGQSIAIVVQVIVATLMLRRKIGSIGFRAWGFSLLRFVIAGIPAGVVAFGWFKILGGEDSWMVPNGKGVLAQLSALPAAMLICAIAGVIYIAMLALLRAPELRTGVNAVLGIVRR